MRFTIAREKLQEGLSAVAASVPAKTTLPVLANLLVETTERGIRLSGTDLDMAVSTELMADVDVQGAITIPAKKLVEIVRELPSAPVKVSSSGEQKVTLECSRSKFKLLGLPKDEFPSFPSIRFNESWRIKSGDLQKLITHTAFASSTEESRPILNGVLWELRPDLIRMVATNGHRLAKMEIPITTAGIPSTDLIIPPKALEQIRRLFPAEEELEVARGDNHLGFRSPFTAVYTRLIEGPYPNYEQRSGRRLCRGAFRGPWRALCLISAPREASFIERIRGMTETDLQGRTVFMSGGSRGIGLAIAKKLAAHGANVALVAKTDQPHPKLEGHDPHGRGGDPRGRRRRAADPRRHPRRRRRRGRRRADRREVRRRRHGAQQRQRDQPRADARPRGQALRPDAGSTRAGPSSSPAPACRISRSPARPTS